MPTRREFLKRSGLLAAAFGAALPAARARPAGPSSQKAARPLPQRKPPGSPRVAAIVTEYRPWSHADVICGRFIQGYTLDVSPHWPPVGLRAMYVDQFPPTDLSRALSKRYGFPIVPSIREAILDSSGKLAVDGVLLIGEHGQYPANDRGQRLYPRRRFFEETARALEEAGEVVPVFNDKHLAATWEDAGFMYRRARELGIPFLAGSSLPVAWRRPWLELPLGTPLDEALSIGYADLEAYGFHALETLQCMIERRPGGESGVKAVQCLEGKAVWDAMREGRFSRELVQAALERNEPPAHERFEERCPEPVAFLIEHRDGFRSTCLVLNPLAGRFLFAAKLTGSSRPVSTQLWLQEPGFGHFSYLTNALVEMFRTGKPPYPVERTVITTGILAAAMDSRFEGHKRLETPHLDIAYQPTDNDLGAYRHPEAANDRGGGWIELWNGRDLDAWREKGTGEARWEAKDGILSGQGGQGYLATLEEFGDLELFVEARISGAAAGQPGGIFVRCQPHADGRAEFPPGYQIQCSAGDPDNPFGSIISLPGARAPAGLARDGEWFTLRARLEGTRLRTWVNGQPAADCRDPEGRYKRGYVALAVRSPGRRMDVREARIRRIALDGV